MFADDFECFFVGPKSKENGMPHLGLIRPLGTGEHGTTNDVGVAWPAQSAPVLIAVYLTGTMANGEARNRTLAAVGRAIADRLSERN